jgi:hypothetical protein
MSRGWMWCSGAACQGTLEHYQLTVRLRTWTELDTGGLAQLCVRVHWYTVSKQSG